MSWKKIAALALLLAVLALAIAVVNNEEEKRQASAGLLLDLPASAVEKIELRTAAGRFLFKRHDTAWRLEAPLAAKADKVLLEGILDNFCPLKYDRLVAENAAELADFGLAKPAIELALLARDRPRAVILLGTKNAIDDSSYARLAGSNRIVTIAAYKRGDLEKDLFAFRDKQVLEIDAMAVEALAFEREGSAVSLARTGERWFLRRPLYSLARESKVGDLLTAASTLQALSFTPLPGPGALGEFGLDQPILDAEFRSPSGTRRIAVGRRNEQYYALAEGAGEICGISRDFLDKFDPAAAAFRETKVAAFFAFDVRKIDFRQGEFGFTVRKNAAGAWEFAKPVPGKEPDAGRIERLLTALADLEAREFIDGAKALPLFPTRIALETEDLSGQGKPGSIVIELSAAAGDTATARNPSLPYQFVVAREILEKLPAKLDDVCTLEAPASGPGN